MHFTKNEVFHTQFPADLVTFTEEILKGKLHFLCSDGAMLASALPFFYVLSGCDTTSSIFVKAKRPMMDAKLFPETTKVFVKLAPVQKKVKYTKKILRTILCCNVQCHV